MKKLILIFCTLFLVGCDIQHSKPPLSAQAEKVLQLVRNIEVIDAIVISEPFNSEEDLQTVVSAIQIQKNNLRFLQRAIDFYRLLSGREMNQLKEKVSWEYLRLQLQDATDALAEYEHMRDNWAGIEFVFALNKFRRIPDMPEFTLSFEPENKQAFDAYLYRRRDILIWFESLLHQYGLLNEDEKSFFASINNGQRFDREKAFARVIKTREILEFLWNTKYAWERGDYDQAREFYGKFLENFAPLTEE